LGYSYLLPMMAVIVITSGRYRVEPGNKEGNEKCARGMG
jgi:hypothetical protein